MAFRGLFIGVDRYSSPGINWLSCAKRDAEALHALFGDTFGDGGVLLADAQATRAAIQTQFDSLVACDPDDLVVIAFSGHGSETHELVPYDADRHDLEHTAIPLATLTEWFSRIPARRLVCILDCCFSGGMGAKALHVDAVPRDIPSEESLLSQLAGEGRLIFTATLPNEKAWETPKTGHGLLTYHLIEALIGAEEVRRDGKIGIYRLLEFVTERVTASAALLKKPQHPSLRGTIDGSIAWPVFRRAERYAAAFPDRIAARATSDLNSLQGFGFPPGLITSWAASIPSLNQLQIDAINDFGILSGNDLVVSAPTSSGKTIIGELAALKGALERKRAFFLFPLKALVNDKLKHFERTYGNFGVRTVRATGDSTADDIVPLMRGQYDVCLMTYEKFAALTIGNPHLLEQVGTVVIDEVQMIADKSRGVSLEFILTLLRTQRSSGVQPQLIALSAVIGSTNGLESWLGARLLRRTDRPVPLDEGIICMDGRFRFISSDSESEQVVQNFIQPEYLKGSSQDIIKPLVYRLVRENKQVIVFRETRGEARGCAAYLAELLGLPPAQAAMDALPVGDPSLASTALRDALNGGVAFHVADLDADERLLIEEQFRARPTALRVIAATTTLAMGINTPTEAVVVAGLTHPGDEPYSVAEYKNMVGRAGRLGQAERGTSFLVAMNSAEEHYLWSRYVLGIPEDLQSRFLANDIDPRSVILRVLVATQSVSRTSQGMTAEEIANFLENSFGAHQQRQRDARWTWDRARVLAAVESLKRHALLETDAENRYHVTPLGRFPGESGVEVETVIRVVGALRGLRPDQITDPTLLAVTQVCKELDNVLFPINRRSKNKEPGMWFGELSRQGIPRSVTSALQANVEDQVQATLRAKKAVACLLWITDRPLNQIEDTLTQFGGKFDGAAGPIRSLRSRTSDLLPVVANIAELLHSGLDLEQRTHGLLVRLELGIPGALVNVGRYAGSRLNRADYLALLRAGFNTPDSISAAPDDDLLRIVNGDRTKLVALRDAARRIGAEPETQEVRLPILPEYVS